MCTTIVKIIVCFMKDAVYDTYTCKYDAHLHIFKYNTHFFICMYGYNAYRKEHLKIMMSIQNKDFKRNI